MPSTRYLADINLRVEIKSFECHDALVWHPRLVKHLGSEQMQTAPKSLSRYANSRYHVESRFGTLDGEVEWIVAVCHVRSGSKKLGNQVLGATPLKRVEAKQHIVRQAMLASVKKLDGSSKAIGCVLLGDFNLTPAQVVAVQLVSLTPNKLVIAVRGYDDVQGICHGGNIAITWRRDGFGGGDPTWARGCMRVGRRSLSRPTLCRLTHQAARVHWCEI